MELAWLLRLKIIFKIFYDECFYFEKKNLNV